MSIQLPQGFKINSIESIDTRLVLSKAEMLSVNDNTMPDVYFAVCKDDSKMYVYAKSNEPKGETGKFRALDDDFDCYTKEQVDRLFTKKEDLSKEIPAALRKALSSQTATNSGLAVDENGNISVQLNQEHLQIIDNKIDLAISTIEAVDGSID